MKRRARRVSSAEITAAPLITATSATASRPRLLEEVSRAGGRTLLAPQNRRGIESRRPPQGNQAADQRDQRRDAKRDGQQHHARRGRRTEHALAEHARQCPRPTRKPRAPPTNASIRCSARKSAVTDVFVAPIAFMMPISARRSSTVAADVAATASAAAISAASVTIQSSVLTCERIFPSESATCRIARTSVAGQHLLDLIADRRNIWRAEPAVVFGGRQRFRIALGERIRRLGHRADEKLSELPGMIRKCFCSNGKRHENGVVFRAPGGDDSRHDQRSHGIPSEPFGASANQSCRCQGVRDFSPRGRSDHGFICAVVKPAHPEFATTDASTSNQSQK